MFTFVSIYNRMTKIEWMVLENQGFGIAVSTGRNRNIEKHELLGTEAVSSAGVTSAGRE